MTEGAAGRRSAGRRRAVLAALYFAEGAPIGFTYWFLGTHLAARGVSDAWIGRLTSAALIPWTLKFLWAPAVDALARGRLGPRGVILLAQAAMVVTLLPLLGFDWTSNLGLLAACLVAHSVAASTQDVGIDAWMISVTPEDDLGRTTAWMQAGYRGAMWLFGYGLLALGAGDAPRSVVLALIAAILLAGLACFGLGGQSTRKHETAHLGAALLALARRRATWIAVGFGLTAGAGFEAAGGGMGRLLQDNGLDERAVGLVASASILGLVPGGYVGGLLADRRGHRPALVAAGLAVAVAVTAVANVTGTGTVLSALGFIYYAAVGAFTAASYAWFAARSTGPARGTAFTLCMAATNGCESWTAAALGALLPRFGWSVALGVLTVIGLAGLAWLFVPDGDLDPGP